MESKKLFLLDAYALIFRAYYAFINRPIKNSKGLNTSAIFGFVNTLEEVLRKETPSHLAVAFDPPAPSFRKEIFPDYKANRQETPEDIKLSVPYIKEILKAYNIPVFEVMNYEADDVIGTLSKLAANNKFTTYMMTPDKDYMQLVDENTIMYKPARSGGSPEIIDTEYVTSLYHIQEPKQVIDILSLWGDSSDNVPGVPGIGEKTAASLISKYGSIPNIYEHIDELKGKQKENLQNSRDQLLNNLELIKIVRDIPLEVNFKHLTIKEIDKQKLLKIFQELEFKTLISRIIGQDMPTKIGPETGTQMSLFTDSAESESSADNLATIENTAHNYVLVNSEGKIKALINTLSKLDKFCFDTETTGLDPLIAELVGLSFSYKKGEAFYVPVSEKFDIAKKQIEHFKFLFENKEIKKIGQNIKYDIQVLFKYDIHVKGELFDTMLAHYLLQPEQRHNMDYLSEIYLSYKPVSIETLIGKKGKHQKDMRDVDMDTIKEYAAEDADITLQLYEKLKHEIQQSGMQHLMTKIESPLIYVLADMENAGCMINTDDLAAYSKQLNKEIKEIKEGIFSDAGEQFNMNSPKQLGQILFEKLKVDPHPKKTKTKQHSTSEEVLQQLLGKHPIIAKILEYRSLNKLLSTYIDALPKLINPNTGKIHTSYNQTITATGRLSSTNPNLQNIPIREERGREIRKSFIPSGQEYALLSADYSQIELRIMAHISGDTEMIAAFAKNEDIHSTTAAKIFKVPLSQVSSDMRRKAKTANFGIIYGISAFGLSQRLSIPREEAKQLIDSYFENYRAIKAYMDSIISSARKNGYVETIMGRKRYIKDINSNNSFIRGMAERNAINTPIQGSAADIIKIAMINIHEILTKFKTNMILQVHDELVFDVYKPELEKIKQLVKKEMENAIQIKVPLIVDMGVGENWLNAH